MATLDDLLNTATDLLRDAVRGEPRRRRGDVFDIASSRDWQYVGFDRLTLEGNVSANGATITNPTNVALPSDKIYEITAIEGYTTNSTSKTGIYAALLQFQIQISKETVNLFSANQSFGPLINSQGSTGQKVWPGGSRIIPPGSTLSCSFTLNTGTLAWSNINEQDLWGIVLTCNTYRI